MLPHTFIHLSGVGPVTERVLWDEGVTTWEEFLSCTNLPPRVEVRRSELCPILEGSRSRLAASNASFFQAALPAGERWRLYGDFRDRAAFLDIETTGLSPDSSHITMVGIYDVDGYSVFVKDENLEDLREAVEKYDLVVTYNGAAFDIPYIEHEFGRIFRQTAHIDLRFPLSRLGYRGGLKSIERRLGLARPSALSGLDGYDAVLLWRMWRQGDKGARDTLVSYNAEDVVSLPRLAEFAYDRLASGLGAPCTSLSPWQHPSLELPYDEDAVTRLRSMRTAHRPRW